MGYDVNKKTAKPAFDTIDTTVAINWANLQSTMSQCTCMSEQNYAIIVQKVSVAR